MRKLAFLPLVAFVIAGCSSDQPTAPTTTADHRETPAAPTEPLAVGATAPDFELKGDDGKTYTLASLTEKGPAFLYFVKADCSANPMAMPHFSKLYDAYGKKLTFVAVVNGPDQTVNGWRQQYHPGYVGLYDGKADITQQFGLEASQRTYLVGKDHKVLAAFHGWGQDALGSLNQAMAKEAKVAVAKLDFSDAPSGRAFG